MGIGCRRLVYWIMGFGFVVGVLVVLLVLDSWLLFIGFGGFFGDMVYNVLVIVIGNLISGVVIIIGGFGFGFLVGFFLLVFVGWFGFVGLLVDCCEFLMIFRGYGKLIEEELDFEEEDDKSCFGFMMNFSVGYISYFGFFVGI